MSDIIQSQSTAGEEMTRGSWEKRIVLGLTTAVIIGFGVLVGPTLVEEYMPARPDNGASLSEKIQLLQTLTNCLFRF